MRSILSALAVCGVLVTGAASPALAQSGVMRPFRGLFGGAAPEPGVHDTLDLTASIGGGYDWTTALAELGPLQRPGAYSNFDAGLTYGHTGKDVQFSAATLSSGRYYRDGGLLGVAHSGSVALAAPLGRRARVQLTQSVSYTPSYLYGLFPSVLTPMEPVLDSASALSNEHALTTASAVQLSYGLSRRGSFEAVGSYQYSRLALSDNGSRNLRSYSAGGRYRYGLSRSASLRLGYVYRRAAYALGDQSDLTIHDIDAGVDYGRALSLSRRTRVTFGTGSSVINSPAEGSRNARLQLRLIGNVTLNHQMGRTWQARASYDRGFAFIQGISRPVFTDAVRTSVSGFLSRRVDLNADAGVSIGKTAIASGTGGEQLRAYTATARLRWALARQWALFGQYEFYDQDLAGALDTETGIPPTLRRNAVSAGLTFWLPVMRK